MGPRSKYLGDKLAKGVVRFQSQAKRAIGGAQPHQHCGRLRGPEAEEEAEYLGSRNVGRAQRATCQCVLVRRRRQQMPENEVDKTLCLWVDEYASSGCGLETRI